MDCKKALEESDGDFDKAVELLRIKGAKDVGKRAERTTAEGMVATNGGALIELTSETDFVAKNAEFQELADGGRRRGGRRRAPAATSRRSWPPRSVVARSAEAITRAVRRRSARSWF